MKFPSSETRRSSLLALVSLCVICCSSIDTITQIQYITDSQFLVSNGSLFRLGFFSPNGSTSRFLGLWYNQLPINVVWVANREKPLVDTSGVLRLSQQGNLVVMNGLSEILWSSNVSTSSNDSTVQLLDSGNLVLQGSSGNLLWQSFDHLGNTLYPTTRVSTNLKNGEQRYLSSWLSEADPSYGNFTATIVPLNIPEIFVWNSDVPYWRSGPWNGQVFIGVPFMDSIYLNGFIINVEEGTTYMTFNFSYYSIFQLNSAGILVQWECDENQWGTIWESKKSDCDIYGKCGAFGSCNALQHPICSCLRGFKPKNASEWNRGNWTNGCVRRSQLKCERAGKMSAGKDDGFLRLNNMKIPDFSEWEGIHEEDCRSGCFANCSCIAYTFVIGIGCMTWSRDLIDVQKFSSDGSSLYLRVAYSELDKKKDYKAIIIPFLTIGAVLIVIGFYVSVRWRTTRKRGGMPSKILHLNIGDATQPFTKYEIQNERIEHKKFHEMPIFSYGVLAVSTNNFSAANKLGKGGFGTVYLGILSANSKIAVKRLSRGSRQGLKEFITEVEVISKLQHRNLVRLLGCCVERDEKMLVYEYMANKSLDAHLFDAQEKVILQWEKRFEIITGIGRGLVYLHRDSDPKIIHRDLKPSNILLDEELNPKISDFGTARIFQSNQNQADTLRAAGTYGYMSPEYAMGGIFSAKSDVYSFGVLMLETVAGRRNNSFHDEEAPLSLIRLAWELWREGNIEALIDEALLSSVASADVEDIRRCIQVGLLCVEESAADRPSVPTILSMLSSEIVDLPTPKQPAFAEFQTPSAAAFVSASSGNNITISNIQGR